MKQRWLSPRAIGMHITVAIVVPLCLALCDWQVHRAISGNDLSWAYVFEWPFFAGYAIYMWWRLVHDDGTLGPRTPRSVAVDDDDDTRLDAYNDYLARLHRSDGPAEN